MTFLLKYLFLDECVYYSGISHGHFTCPEFVGQNIQEFCHVNDVQQLTKHLQEGKGFSNI